jgi:hypothetical protein
MDKTKNTPAARQPGTPARQPRDWSWFSAHMPQVAAQLAEYREAGEGAHIDMCWHRGVLRGEPGWFFAKEGAVTVGTPFDERGPYSVVGAMERAAFASTGALLQLADLPVGRELIPCLSDKQRRIQELLHGAH